MLYRPESYLSALMNILHGPTQRPGPLPVGGLNTGPNQPGQQVPGPGPLPIGGLNSGPNQPGQPVPPPTAIHYQPVFNPPSLIRPIHVAPNEQVNPRLHILSQLLGGRPY